MRVLRDEDGDIVLCVLERTALTKARTMSPHYYDVQVRPFFSRGEMLGYCILVWDRKSRIGKPKHAHPDTV